VAEKKEERQPQSEFTCGASLFLPLWFTQKEICFVVFGSCVCLSCSSEARTLVSRQAHV